MPPVKREQANQHRKRSSPAKARRARAKLDFHTAPARLSSSIDDELGTALALAFSIELMGFGWESFGDDYSKALLTITRLLIEHLGRAKSAYSAMREQERKDSQSGTPPKASDRS